MEFLAIDVETAASGHICEIGCARVANRQITDICSWLVKPSCYPNFSPAHQAIHGIHAADLKNASTFKELWESDLERLITPKTVLIAHNATFDVEQIATEMKRNGIKPLPIRYFCTMQQSRKWLKGLEGYGLKSVCKFLKIDLHNHHRAKDDAVATAKIYIKLPRNNVGIKVRKI